MGEPSGQHEQPSLFGGDDARVLSGREAELVRAYEVMDRPLDDLPYTEAFEVHILGFESAAGVMTGEQRALARESLHTLQRLRKSGRLPRVGGRSGDLVQMTGDEAEALRGCVLAEIETLGQRDRLPYTDALDRIVERFNAEVGKNYDHHAVWRMVARLAK